MSTWADSIHMRERGYDADGPMPAHSQIRYVVEKDHSGHAGIVDGSAQQSTDDSVRATRLVDKRAAKIVVLSSKALDAI
jgi:hypothetical protein